MSEMTPEGKSKLRRNWTQKAIDLALKGHWKEAIRVNESILSLFPTDVEARNRIGKAYLELGQYEEALAAYRAVLEVIPHNAIARKNIRRLESLIAGPVPPVKRASERIAPHLFLEEIGKTAITTLHRPASAQVLAGFAAGDPVMLREEKGVVHVVSETGLALGIIEPGLSRRLVKLQKAGNRYAAALISVSDGEVKVIVRETYHHPSMAGRPSFHTEEEKVPQPYAKGFVRYLEEDEDIWETGSEDEDADVEAVDEEEEADLLEDAEALVEDEDLEKVEEEAE
jgi:tetratricopeptide (TPR) repeat protein